MNMHTSKAPLLVVAVLLVGLGCPPPVPADPPAAAPVTPPTGSTLRFLSLAIRDVPPSIEETTAFLAGDRSLDSFTTEWLASPQHEARVRRYFSDFFGLTVGFTPFDQFLLEPNASGVYRLASKPDCTLDEAVAAPAWWLDEGETILMCPTSLSDEVVFPLVTDDPTCVGIDPSEVGSGCFVLCNAVANQQSDPRCGCGREQLLCLPCEQTGADPSTCDVVGRPDLTRNREVERDFNQESVERGLFAYQQNLSWFDYLGGDFFYGTRGLYLSYLLGQGAIFTQEVSTADAVAQIRALPVVGSGRAPWPTGVMPRAGLVTSPGYLDTYNTVRGRARALSQRLLCHDVDETLNIDDFRDYPNPNHTPADIAHGSNPRCNFCHFGMDNQAAMLFGYDRDGTAQFINIQSQIGHVFGEDGVGPADLIRGYVERGPGFDECMAKRAFNSFSGLSFDQVLTDAERAEFTRLAKGGPKPLIEGILQSPILLRAAPQ